MNITLWNAAIDGDFDLIKKLLETDEKKNLDNTFYWLTLKHCDNPNYLEMAKLLIEKGARECSETLSILAGAEKYEVLKEIFEFCE